MELAQVRGNPRARRLKLTTIDRVAADLGESLDRLHDVATGMDAEDGVIWVYGPGDDQVMAVH